MSIFTDLGARLGSIFWRGREERELDEELRFHLDMESEHRRRAGAQPEAARRRGAIALGGIERTKEDVRDARGTRAMLQGRVKVTGNEALARRMNTLFPPAPPEPEPAP